MTILTILEDRARDAPDAVALHAPGRPLLSYSGLLEHVVRTAADLRRRGISPQFIPALIIPLNEIPHGPNGKIDRAALPDPSSFLGAPSPALEEPKSWVERHLAKIWKELLDIVQVRTRDSFFDLGGHSLLAVRMLQRVADEIGEVISLRAFYDDPTIHAVASLLTGGRTAMAGELPPILKLRESAAWPTLFYLNGQPPGGGHYAKRLAPYLPADQGLYIVPIPIFEAPITVEGTATRMIELIRTEQPKGPYLLAGNCFGATLALEIAQQLHASGERVSLVALIHPEAQAPMHLGFRVMRRVALLSGIPREFHVAEFSSAMDYILRTLREVWREQRRASPRQRAGRAMEATRWVTGFVVRNATRPFGLWSTLRRRVPRETDEAIQNRMRQDWLPLPDANESGDQTADREMEAHRRYLHEAWYAYVPKNYPGAATIIWPVEGGANPPWDPRALWTRLMPALDWHAVPGNHYTVLHEYLEHSARALGASIERARQP